MSKDINRLCVRNPATRSVPCVTVTLEPEPFSCVTTDDSLLCLGLPLHETEAQVRANRESLELPLHSFPLSHTHHDLSADNTLGSMTDIPSMLPQTRASQSPLPCQLATVSMRSPVTAHLKDSFNLPTFSFAAKFSVLVQPQIPPASFLRFSSSCSDERVWQQKKR